MAWLTASPGQAWAPLLRRLVAREAVSPLLIEAPDGDALQSSLYCKMLLERIVATLGMRVRHLTRPHYRP